MYALKNKLTNYQNLKEINLNFKDFNEYFILNSAQNIYTDVKEAIAVRDHSVMLRSIKNNTFNVYFL